MTRIARILQHMDARGLVDLARMAPGDPSAWQAVGAGESGAAVLRHESGDRYVKIVPADQRADLEAERDRVTWLGTTDIPGPTVVDWHSSADGAYLITSTVEGRPAHELDAAALRRAWSAIASVVVRLHSVPITDCPFDRSLARMWSLAESAVAERRVRTEFLPVSLQQTPPDSILSRLHEERERRLAQEAAAPVVCHGDLCLPNIMIDPETNQVTGLIDLGRLGRADPYADISLLLETARSTWGSDTETVRAESAFSEQYGAELDAARRQFYLWLDPLTW